MECTNHPSSDLSLGHTNRANLACNIDTKPLQGHSCCQSHRTPLQGQVPRGSLRSNMTVGQWPRLFFVYVVLFFDVCYFFDVSFHKRRAEFVAMPHIATYRISGRPLIPIVYSSCFLLLPEPQTAQTARPRSSSVEKRRLYYFHLNYPTTGL